MKSFNVSANNIEYLLGKRIKANSKDEAVDIYVQMWEEGMIEVANSELNNVEVEEAI